MQIFQGKLILKILKSKLFIITVIAPLVIEALIFLYFINLKELTIFPNSQIFKYEFYSDGPAGGNSQILNQAISDSLIKLDFKIGNKINNPYAGINIGPKNVQSISAGHYNQLIIKAKGEEINGIGIALVTQNSIKDTDKKTEEILFYHIFKIYPGINTYKISVDKFEVPDWWGENNRIEDASTIRPNLKNLEVINVNSAFTPITGKRQSLEIYSITFSRNNNPLFILLLIIELGIIFIALMIIFSIEKIQASKKSITISYKAVENDSSATSKSDFIDFINHNFQNSELTLDFVSGETGASQRKIANDIQNQFACNFKTYINRLRINESKRLLLKGELNIGEIAFKVGFNNQSHFNRVFKSEMQISPTEYRDKNRK
jgi:AraC-like DNA-binding protein